MRKPRSERSRWVQVFLIAEPAPENANGYARQEHAKLRAVVHAFQQVGRVVRVETAGGNMLVFKARKA